MWWWLASCNWFDGPSVIDEPPSQSPARPAARAPSAIALGRGAVPGTFTLPPSSRPGQEEAPARFPLAGPLELFEKKKHADIYRTPLPVLDHLLPSEAGGTHRFGSREPPGFVVSGPMGKLNFERGGRLPYSYGFDREWLYIGLKKGSPAPDAAAFTVGFAKATDTENGLNLATSGLQPEAFVRRTVTVGTESWSGLYLPAPAEASFDLTLPERATLSFDARILAPAIASATRSDGASVQVLLRKAGSETVLREVSVPVKGSAHVEVDLSAHAGPATLILRTGPGEKGDGTYDYLLLEAPTIHAASPGEGRGPQRIIVVFVDTLRADHLGFMGYERPTPVLDRLAAHAAVFEQARTVAPWTLPSARSMLTGRQPEAWYASQTLAEALSDAGWRTEAIVTNAFLSQPFDMHRGWDHFSYEHMLPADDIVDRAVSVIEAHADRDLLLMVHFMEPHLPYEEPWTYRRMYSGSAPDTLQALNRHSLLEVSLDDPQLERVVDYVTGRYDQNIRFVDHELRALFDAAGRDATIVLLSDHGEELWDHGSFEHGHSFYDELLRVPLVIRSPNVGPGRYQAPVSLMDVTPTLREIAGLPPIPDAQPTEGRSLVALTFGESGEAEAFTSRPLAFGRPLYGTDGWGVLSERHKWWDRGGIQALYALEGDPGELTDLAPKTKELGRWPQTLQAALGRKVEHAWRLDLTAVEWPYDLELTASHPQGFSKAWLGYDPRGRNKAAPVLQEGRVSLRIEKNLPPPPTLYLVPGGDPYEPKGLAITLVGRGVMVGGTSERGRLVESHDPQTILATGNERFRFLVDLAWVPEPSGVDVAGFHPDLEAQLQQLGYLEGAEPQKDGEE